MDVLVQKRVIDPSGREIEQHSTTVGILFLFLVLIPANIVLAVSCSLIPKLGDWTKLALAKAFEEEESLKR